MLKNCRKKGFTLLELLVVVLIIGILAGIALPQYRKAVGKAELAQVISATKAVQNAQERYYLVHNQYATTFQALDIDLPNTNVTCRISDQKYSQCYNKNYIIAHFYAEDDHNNVAECYARNKNLTIACENFLQAEAHLSENSTCKLMSGIEPPCWEVVAYLPM